MVTRAYRFLFKLNYKKGIASLLASSLLFTAIAPPFAQANLWSERRAFLDKKQENPLTLASLPANLLGTDPNLHCGANWGLSPIKPLTPDNEELFTALGTLPGAIRKISAPSKNKGQTIVLHIQDVHLNQEAQTNIGSTLEGLLQMDHVNLVALEGAFGPIDLNRFRKFPHQDAIHKVADYLLKTNKISGAIHAAFNSPKEIPELVGIDDAYHYHANVNAYRESSKQVQKNSEYLSKIKES